jgi:hypothetical protein
VALSSEVEALDDRIRHTFTESTLRNLLNPKSLSRAGAMDMEG